MLRRAASVQHLRIVRRLRRRLDRDRLDGAAVGLGAAMRGALRDHDEVARFHLHFLVVQPDRAGAVEDVLNLVGVGCMCLPTLPSWIEMVMPSAATNSLERMPVPE